MSGERIALIGDLRYASLAEKHVALRDLPGPKSGRVGVLEKIESYAMDANTINRKELAKRTPFFSRDQREHIIEEVKAEWATRRPYVVDGYKVESHIREGNQNVSLQYSFRDVKTGKFVRPKEEKENE